MLSHMAIHLLLGVALAQHASAEVPLPSVNQLKALDIGLSMFIHFSVNPWSNIEHNCVGHSPDCIPASAFNPTNLSTDQWVETAVAFGAKEICLTAHHEGGFCLWDTNYTDYSVMNSPYGRDVVQQFVASCQKYNIQPCYYIGPNANGYLSNKLHYTAEQFIQAQLGMFTELLENYPVQPGRLWWDHYPGGCAGERGLDPCPAGSFPNAWSRFIDLVREKSPHTIICPGPDCTGHQGESGRGTYPSWNPCNVSETHNTCKDHAPNPQLQGFQPYETCATMMDGWFCKGDGRQQSHWDAGDIWDHYMRSVGEGWINTLNAPVCTTGQIPHELVTEMKIFGTALRSLFDTVHASKTDIVASTCNNTTVATLQGLKDTVFNAVILREDLTKGQRITKYALDHWSEDSNEWIQFSSGVHGQSVGNLLIDWVDPYQTTNADQVRVRCLEAMEVPVYLKSVSVHMGTRPRGRSSTGAIA